MLLVVVLVLSQVVLVSRFSINGIKPNVVLLMVAVWSMLFGLKEGSLWALMSGLLLDLLSGAPFGLSSLSLLAVSALAGLQVWRTIHVLWFLPALVAACSLTHDLTFTLLMQLSGLPVAWSEVLVHALLPGALWNAGLAVLAFPFVRFMPPRPEAEEEPEGSVPRQSMPW